MHCLFEEETSLSDKIIAFSDFDFLPVLDNTEWQVCTNNSSNSLIAISLKLSTDVSDIM